MNSNTFPQPSDLPNLDPVAAKVALEALRCMVAAEEADVYSCPRTNTSMPLQWNVWFEITRRRVDLCVWAAVWLDAQRHPAGGDAI